MTNPKASVKIYKSPTVYYDASLTMTSYPVINKSVNRGGMFTFSISNDGASNGSIIKDTFSGWSDESEGAVTWGQYVLIENIDENGTAQYMTDGYITTIELDEYTVKITCADHLAVLGSMGADIRRNYYNTTTQSDTFSVTGAGEGSAAIAVDITQIINNEGTPQDPIFYRVKETKSRTGSDALTNMQEIASISTLGKFGHTVTWSATFPMFNRVAIRLYHDQNAITSRWSVTINIKNASGQIIATAQRSLTYTGMSSGAEDMAITYTGIYPAGAYVVEIIGVCDSTTGPYPTARLGVILSTDDATGSTIKSDGTITHNNTALKGDVDIFTEHTVTNWSQSGNNLIITGISGVSIDATTKPDLTNPSANRARVSYYSGSITISEIMQNIIERVGYTADIDLSGLSGGVVGLRAYRTGGGYALDYLQKLADIVNGAREQTAFIAKGNATKTVYVGARRSSANTPSYIVEYGNTTNALIMYEFKPKKSMKNRPSRIMIKGTKDDNTGKAPLTAIIYNRTLTESRGLITDTIQAETTALNPRDAIQQAYSTVNSDGNEWEGELTLSGITPELIESEGENAGSGKVLKITDPRYNINGQNFVITDEIIDYNNATVKLTLSNAPSVYSSAINDTIANALSITDMASANAGSSLYNSQFVYLSTETAQTILNTGNTITVITGAHTFNCTEVAVYRLPDGRTLIYGAVAIDSTKKSTAKYDVSAVKINGGASLSIPADRRPDAYEGQYLVINIDCPT